MQARWIKIDLSMTTVHTTDSDDAKIQREIRFCIDIKFGEAWLVG